MNADRFPFQGPIVELYRWNPLSTAIRHLKNRLTPRRAALNFDHPKTLRALKRYNVKVLHAHFGYTGYQLLSIKRQTGLPLVTTFYGEDLTAFPRIDKWKTAYDRLFSEGDMFLVEGSHMLKRLIQIGCPLEKAGIQRTGLILEKYPFRIRQPASGNRPIRLLFCGSFREKKGLLCALDAVRKAYDQHPCIELRIIGDGELRDQVVDFIHAHRMSGYTFLLGFQTHEQMIREMDASDIFIHPSQFGANGDGEGGAPTTIIEAQACGMPVLTTDHADIPNVVAPGESALISPEKDSESLKQNLSVLIEQQQRWPEMGTAGHRFVEKHHDISKEIESLENRYRRIASRV